MRSVYYKITLEQPVLVTSLNGDPNSSVAFDYIPGSVIRGVFIGREKHPIDATDVTIRRRYFDGSTPFLNAYPLINNQRALPVPASWRQLKVQHTSQDETDNDDTRIIYDFANKRWQDDKQRVRLKTPFFAFKSIDEYELHQPNRYLNIHIDRGKRKKGRADETDGAIYRYDAIAKDEVFVGVILCRDDDANHLIGNMPKTAFIGGARTGGYGRVRFEVIDDLSSGPVSDDGRNRLHITALSNILLRTTDGGFATSGEDIAVWLRMRGINATLVQSFDNVTEIGGFNRKWGLPLPQNQAIEMGSVFVFQGDFSSDAIRRLREDTACGVGDRTIDGFGQIAVNMIFEDKFTCTKHKPAEVDSSPLNGDDKTLAQDMLKRIVQQKLEDLLMDRVSEYVNVKHDADGKEIIPMPVDRIPSPSQLAQLRAVIQREDATLATVERFREAINKRQTARKQFERFSVNNMSFWKWWQKTVNEVDLELLQSLASESAIADEIYEPDASQTDQYRLRLLDEVLAQAIRQKKGSN